MILKCVELLNVVLSALVGGMYWGPYLALSRSLNTFEPDVFLSIAHRLNQNMAGLMTYLTPLGLLSTLPTLYLSFGSQVLTFWLTLAGLVCFLTALLVTVQIEVPIVRQIVSWAPSALPTNWKHLRDRWMRFHWIRVLGGLVGLTCLAAGAIF
ncbi:anthrone oxygenase family protein [Spirosoma panaciterrae]|uniref:anthrone oxygenase family protein n=1 Tax=Spirosoma panaciterrae TaxID=496058 RepID=UPI00035F3BAF|nr:anthrone oxygenase family protein [Spirosoma panaciterrae]